MTTSCALTGSVGSSISIIDAEAGRYVKVAEWGTACRLGQSFPLDEGVTGRVMAGRRPIVLSSYQDVASGHLPPGSRARDGAVAAIPIWWRGEVIGANVVFAGRTRSYTAEEIDQLEVVTQVVAPGVVTAAGRDLAMTNLFRRDHVPDPQSGVRCADPGCSSVAEVALGLAKLVARIVPPTSGSSTPVQVRVVRDEAVLRLQVLGAGEPVDVWHDLVEGADGDVAVVPAGERDRFDGPDHPGPASHPLTVREQQVLGLLSRGISDRAIAEALKISPKTAGKHVGAVLRKTGTNCRTAAVVHALELGWVVHSPAQGS